MILYHATRKSTLDSIMSEGLSPSYYGAIHGSMEYPLPKPCIFLSSLPNSENLNSTLFDQGEDEVVVLTIDAAGLDEDAFHCDDSLYSIVDGEHLEFVEDAADLREAVKEFSEAYNLPKAAVRKAFKTLIAGEDDSLYQTVLRGFWREALEVDKVVSYAGVIPPDRIMEVTPYIEAHQNAQQSQTNLASSDAFDF
jgi:hypothetical protein